ncbi:MAG TPA: glycosyltransferase family 2 protein [Chloroflexi bacterium]|nr:glycosyltransferase family 2 protein [Chloroflexota bacterium]
MPELAVIIVSWNVCHLLARCLDTLYADLARTNLNAEVWVVDNASTDGTAEMVSARFPTVHLRANAENLWFLRGNNLALQEILALDPPPAHIWLLNPDTEVEPGATEALLSVLRTSPDIGVSGARLLYPDGSHQQSAFRFPGLLQLAFDLFPLPARLYDTPLNGRYPYRYYQQSEPFQIDHPLGAAMMVRSAAIAQVGLLDEAFWMYCEEVDWCWRMSRAGWRAVCVPRAQVIHHAGSSSEQVRIPSFIALWTSRARLYARYHGPFTRRLARAMVRIGMRRRARTASPEMADACSQVIQVWEEIV